MTTRFSAPPRPARRPAAPFLRRAALLCLLAVIALAAARPAAAGPVIIRDTEIERILRDWATPVMRAAGLEPDAVKIILVQDPAINAFVAGGQNLFIYSGLIERSENADEVIGVMAHEIGHISGGHLTRTYEALRNASYESVLGTILGIGAALASGDGQVGAAVMAGTSSTAVNRFLAFSRVQESSADQAGLSYLEKSGFSPGGFLSFTRKLESDELLPPSQQNEYVRTHPLTRDRVDAIRAAYDRSPYRDKALPAAWQEDHRRIKAKLKAFITPERVAWDYDTRDKSLPAEYARAIAAYRQNKVKEALERADGLLALEKDNPYFLELKGQMLVDFSRVAEAAPYYEKAVALDPRAPLIRTAYAHALIETADGRPARLDEAISHLTRAAADEPRTGRIYRLLATAYGRKGDEPMAKLYLAEEAVLQRQWRYARLQAEGALQGLPASSRSRVRAQDILAYVEQNEKKDPDSKNR